MEPIVKDKAPKFRSIRIRITTFNKIEKFRKTLPVTPGISETLEYLVTRGLSNHGVKDSSN